MGKRICWSCLNTSEMKLVSFYTRVQKLFTFIFSSHIGRINRCTPLMYVAAVCWHRLLLYYDIRISVYMDLCFLLSRSFLNHLGHQISILGLDAWEKELANRWWTLSSYIYFPQDMAKNNKWNKRERILDLNSQRLLSIAGFAAWAKSNLLQVECQ